MGGHFFSFSADNIPKSGDTVRDPFRLRQHAAGRLKLYQHCVITLISPSILPNYNVGFYNSSKVRHQSAGERLAWLPGTILCGGAKLGFTEIVPLTHSQRSQVFASMNVKFV